MVYFLKIWIILMVFINENSMKIKELAFQNDSYIYDQIC